VRKSFHGAGRIAGWVTSEEVPLRAGGGCGVRARIPTSDGRGPVPEHIAELYGDACDGCESERNAW